MRIQETVKRNGPFLRQAAFVLAILLLQVVLHPAYCALLSIEKGAGQIKVSWAAGLGLVQIEKTTELSGGAWNNFGEPTADASVTDTAPRAKTNCYPGEEIVAPKGVLPNGTLFLVLLL